MKNATTYIAGIRMANLSETPKQLIEMIELIQKDAIMQSFKNTSEDFNMEALQGISDMSNDEIYKKLIS